MSAGALAEDAPREIPEWEKSSKYEIICGDADKVSYRATEYQHTGGAHIFNDAVIPKPLR